MQMKIRLYFPSEEHAEFFIGGRGNQSNALDATVTFGPGTKMLEFFEKV
jgi:hypothetical protein